jgi:hypothetical protein
VIHVLITRAPQIAKSANEYRSDQYEKSPDSGSSAQELDSLLLSSGQTLITQPDNDNRAGELDHILDATAYYEKLDMLESDTAEMSDPHPSGWKFSKSASTRFTICSVKDFAEVHCPS